MKMKMLMMMIKMREIYDNEIQPLPTDKKWSTHSSKMSARYNAPTTKPTKNNDEKRKNE